MGRKIYNPATKKKEEAFTQNFSVVRGLNWVVNQDFTLFVPVNKESEVTITFFIKFQKLAAAELYARPPIMKYAA